MRRSHVIPVALVVLATTGIASWYAVTWHAAIGTFNPLVVRDIKAYERRVLDPLEAVMNGPSPRVPVTSEAAVAAQQLAHLDEQVARHDRALTLAPKEAIPDRFTAHFAAKQQSIRAMRTLLLIKREATELGGGVCDHPNLAARYEDAQAAWYSRLIAEQREFSRAAGVSPEAVVPTNPQPSCANGRRTDGGDTSAAPA